MMFRGAIMMLCCLLGAHSIDYTHPHAYSPYFDPSEGLGSVGGHSQLFESSISDVYQPDPLSNFPDQSKKVNFVNGLSFNNFGNGFNFNFPKPPAAQPQPQQPQGIIAPGCGTPPVSCPKTRYRSYDGSCNNLRNPVLGTPNTPYTRLLGPKYGDGISTPTESTRGAPLPGARLVSIALFPDVPIQDPIWTLVAMQYGQIITHDMSMIAGSTQTKPHQTQCCSDDGQLLQNANIPEHCFPIVTPRGDPLYTPFNINCMNFVRTITDRDRRCVGGQQPAEQLTAVNHFLDLSLVYGNTQALNTQLRTFQGGKMRTEQRGGQDWPPANANKTGACAIDSIDEPCYLAGDVRVNQNPQLTILQIILLREHNRVADVLASMNPHWSDETLFQEARRICIGEHQHISYYEWLPIFIGLQNSHQNKILYQTKSFVDDYNVNVDPTVLNEHATAAFRFFHSLIAGHLDLVPEHRHAIGNIRLSDWFNRPLVLEQDDNFDELTRGMGTQPELASDQFMDSEVTKFLFRARNNTNFGEDLRARDIQRNRDHGLASYNDYRQFCGLRKAYTFNDFQDLISPNNVRKLANLFESVDDVDLTVGGFLEKLVPGTLAGPTFLCILTEQFYRTRVGDRFWYEHGHDGAPFTIEQVNELRKSSISRLFCDNGHHIQSMQPRGFEQISPQNVVVPCELLPVVDLSLWRDVSVNRDANQHGHLYY